MTPVVSGERVSKMTRTYSDPEALTRLLEEEERDLELAAHIGQGLLRDKRELAGRADALEAELLQAQEALT
ncbi:trafficking kinesin-binding protein 1-like isoform X2 [Haemaphysalis longicornis]